MLTFATFTRPESVLIVVGATSVSKIAGVVAISFDIVNGNNVKNSLGCPCDLI